MDILLRRGLLVDPASGTERTGDLCVSDGRIVAVGSVPHDFSPVEIIDAAGLAVCPGLVDLSVRLRHPGFEHRVSPDSELAAAVAGGVTTVVCQPDMDPMLDEPGLVERLVRAAQATGLSRVLPVGALTQGLRGERLAEMVSLAAAGCVAFSQADQALPDHAVMLRAMQYASTFGLPVWMQPRDAALSRSGVAHEGAVATRLGLPGIPSLAETLAVATLLLMARETGARLHLCRLSSARSVALVREARAAGVPVTCDVSAHHVHLCEDDIGYFDTHCRLSPPLRARFDRDALRAGLADGTIDAICSDHSPVDADGKQMPFAEADPGAAGLETLLSLALMADPGGGLPAALAPVTTGPARVLGLAAPRLELGAVADICVFDPAERWQVQSGALVGKGRATPMDGCELRGRVRACLVAGQLAFQRS